MNTKLDQIENWSFGEIINQCDFIKIILKRDIKIQLPLFPDAGRPLAALIHYRLQNSIQLFTWSCCKEKFTFSSHMPTKQYDSQNPE